MARDWSNYDLLAWLWCKLPDGRHRMQAFVDLLANGPKEVMEGPSPQRRIELIKDEEPDEEELQELVAWAWTVPGLLDGCPTEPTEMMIAVLLAIHKHGLRAATDENYCASHPEVSALVHAVYHHFATETVPA